MDDSGLKQLVEQVRRLLDQAEPSAAAAPQDDARRLLFHHVRLLCAGAEELLQSKQDLQGRLSRKPAADEAHLDLLQQWAERHGLDLSQDSSISHP